MSDTTAGLLQVGLLIAALARVLPAAGRLHGPGLHQRPRHPRGAGRLPRRWASTRRPTSAGRSYARALLAFSAVGVLFLYALQRFQPHLPLTLGFPGVAPGQAFNTAASFVTNTNWQSYSGESTMGHLVQMAGLAVQNFVSAAVGMAVAVALIRGFTRSRTDRIGNFWVDLVRGSRAHPAAARGGRRRRAGRAGRGAELLRPAPTSTTLAGGHQTITGGPVASQEAIKELGTNGGGFYNANSAHPFENPNAVLATSSRSSCCCSSRSA